MGGRNRGRIQAAACRVRRIRRGGTTAPTIDTEVVIEGIRRGEPFPWSSDKKRRETYVALHTLMEVRRGLRGGGSQQARIRFLKEVGIHARVLPFERQAALFAGEMAAVLDETGQRIPVSDLCIASSSLIWGDGEVVTHDFGHFAKLRRFGLRVRMA